MAKDTPNTRLDISEECYRVKGYYRNEPGKDVVKDIKEFLKDGMPHNDPRHTHTRPAKGAPVKYLDDFKIADKFRKKKHFAPCPCCTPSHRKFGHGKIAWFPEERVIRLLGPQCFASLNPEGHQQAEDELRQRKQREQDINFLLESHSSLVKAKASLMPAMQIANALDEFGSLLRKRIYETLNIPIWPRICRGELRIWDRVSQVNQKTGEVEHLPMLRLYAGLPGYRILDPSLRGIADRLYQPLKTLEILDVDGNWNEHINSISDGDRHSTAILLRSAIRRTGEIIREINDLKSFINNLATLRTWGQLESCPEPIFLDFNNTHILVGRSEFTKVRISIPPILHSEPIEFKATNFSIKVA